MMNDQGQRGATMRQDPRQASWWDHEPTNGSSRQEHQSTNSNDEDDDYHDEDWGEVLDARPILPKAAFFMGDLRDGLPMVRAVHVQYLLA
jgi:hypothetical protein